MAAVALVVAAAGSPATPATAQVDVIDWLDHSFGGGLQTFDESPDQDVASGVAVQDDGKVVVVATSGYYPAASIHVRRFLADGQPDTAFGAGGTVAIVKEGLERGTGVVIQDDGRIVVAGTGNTDWGGRHVGWGIVARLSPAGEPDPSFAGVGMATVDVEWPNTGHFDTMALAPGGRIVLAGSFSNPERSGGLLVARLDADGTLDEGFASGGVLLRHPPPAGLYTGWNERAASVHVRPDGSVVVGGSVFWRSEVTGLRVSGWFLVTKITPAGGFDPAFGDNGSVYTDAAGGTELRYSSIAAMAVQADGRIVAAGWARYEGGGPDGYGYKAQVVARYLADGKPDPSFGSSGVVVSQVPPTPRSGTISAGGATAGAVAVDAKGRIVVGGSASGYSTTDMTVTRYTPAGLLDRSFGRGDG